jgi:hypothetical protein
LTAAPGNKEEYVASSNELVEFVGDALARGASRAEIEAVLQHAGWSRDMIRDAKAAYADVAFPVPVPKPKPYVSAKEAFLYGLLFSTLYLAAYNTGLIAFLFIDHAFPDAAVLAYPSYVRQEMRWALSALIVSFPVFLYLSVLVERSVRQDPVKRRSRVRRQLMYLTVFIAAIVLMCDFVALVYNVLGGELTTRFILKVGAIAAIAGAIFGYYLSDVRLEDTTPEVDDRHHRVFAVSATVLVAAMSASALALIGWPANERARHLDSRRIADLRRISQSANVYFQRHGRLPASLAELSSEPGLSLPAGDASTDRYDYRVSGGTRYEVCATFQRHSSESEPFARSDFWAHGPGRQCFQLEAKARVAE